MYTKEELEQLQWDLDRHNIGVDSVDVDCLIQMALRCLVYEDLLGKPLGELLNREKQSRAEQETIDELRGQLQVAEAQRARAKAEAADALKALKAEQDRHALTKKDHDVVLDEKKTAKAELDKWILAAKSLGRVANPQELYTWGIQFHDMERELNATDNDLYAWKQAGEQLGCLTPDDLVTLKTKYEAMQKANREYGDDMTYKPAARKPNMDLAKKYHAELNANFNALTSLLDSPPEGLDEEELQSLRESRALKVTRAARQLEAALRGEKFVLRGVE